MKYGLENYGVVMSFYHTSLANQSSVSTYALGRDMRLIFVLLVFLPALIYGRLMYEDEPSNSENEELGIKDCVDPDQVSSTLVGCMEGEKCNSCWCKSKDTGKTISFKC